jgi:carbonic anhydrase/acetyltransferase-like protein (isoleucine patch superfamily)
VHITLDDRSPAVSDGGWTAPNATLVGDVSIGANSSVWYGAVLRADIEVITIGSGSNVQDCCVVHVGSGFPATVGDGVSVGHGAVLHGCTIEDDVLVGMGATILNGARVGAGSLVAAGALILQGTVVPPGSLVAGVPGKVRRPLSEDEVRHIRDNATTYVDLARRHRRATS